VGERVHAAGAGGRATRGADAGRDAREGAPLGGGRKRGAEAQAIGRSRGGRTTKIHIAVDEHGRPRRLIVRPGHRGDAPVAAELIGDFAPALCLADTAYDSDAIRALLIARGGKPVIPNNPTRKRKHPFDRNAYRLRNIVERTFCRLKDWRRIATRYDRLARNFLAAVALASLVTYWL
jgi:transposase